MEYMICKTDELTHWGVKGMRWGVRRYQNKDGSLTPAGQKRYNAEMAKVKEAEATLKRRKATQAKIDKLEARKKAVDEGNRELDGVKATKSKKGGKVAPATSKPKSMKDMTDDELRDSIARMQLEKNYVDAAKSLAAANPPQVSKGKQFMNTLVNDVVAPAAKEVGKDYIKKFMKDKLGLSDKDTKSLMPEVKTWEDMIKKQTWEKEDRNQKEAAKKAAEDAAKKAAQEKAAKEAEEKAAKEQKAQEKREAKEQRAQEKQAAKEQKAQEKREAEERAAKEAAERERKAQEERAAKEAQNVVKNSGNTKVSDVPKSTVNSGKTSVNHYGNWIILPDGTAIPIEDD